MQFQGGAGFFAVFAYIAVEAADSGFERSLPVFKRSLPGFNIAKPSFKRSLPGFNIAKPSFKRGLPIFKRSLPGFNIAKPIFKRGLPGFNIAKPSFKRGLPGFNIAKPVFDVDQPVTQVLNVILRGEAPKVTEHHKDYDYRIQRQPKQGKNYSEIRHDAGSWQTKRCYQQYNIVVMRLSKKPRGQIDERTQR